MVVHYIVKLKHNIMSKKKPLPPPAKKKPKVYPKATPKNISKTHTSKTRGEYYQAKGTSHDVKAIAKKKGKSVAAVKGKAAAPGRKSYKDVAGFLNIQK